VVSTLGAALCVTAILHAHVHTVDRRCCSTSSKRMAGEQSPQSFGAYLPSIQRSVKAALAATMRRFEAQVILTAPFIAAAPGCGIHSE
jgi:hypothetical protein